MFCELQWILFQVLVTRCLFSLFLVLGYLGPEALFRLTLQGFQPLCCFIHTYLVSFKDIYVTFGSVSKFDWVTFAISCHPYKSFSTSTYNIFSIHHIFFLYFIVRLISVEVELSYQELNLKIGGLFVVIVECLWRKWMFFFFIVAIYTKSSTFFCNQNIYTKAIN